MNPKKSIKLYVLTLIVAVAFILPQNALAAFNVTVTPNVGGAELRFSPVVAGAGEMNAEINIEISTDIAAQYELRQEPLMPIRDAKGNEISWDNFTVRGLRNTNKYGTLKIQSEPVRNYILYTSNQTGTADSFILVYTLTPPIDIEPGFYRGQIRFTLQPITSAQAPVSQNLYVIVEAQKESVTEGAKPKIEFTTPEGAKAIYLKYAQEEKRVGEMQVNINGSFKNMFKIFQVLAHPIESKEGNRLEYNALNLETKDVGLGEGIGLTPLGQGPQVIYTSRPTGEADDSFTVLYSLTDLSIQKAGRYSTNMQYYLEESGQPQKLLDTFALEIENERIFELGIIPGENRFGLQFDELKPNEPPRVSELTIVIKSNIGRTYQVSQNMPLELANKEGYKIPNKYFTLRTESLDSKGTVRLPEKTEAQKGIMVLFVSDKEGSSDKFKIIYELTCPEDIRSGNYSTHFTYSVSEI